MNSFDMFRDGAATLTGLTPTPGDREADQARRFVPAEYNHDVELTAYEVTHRESVEIDLFETPQPGSDIDENDSVPLSNTARVTSLFWGIRDFMMFNFRRPRFLRNMKHSTSLVALIMCVILYLVFWSVQFVVGLLPVSTSNGYIWGHFFNKTAQIMTTTSQHSTPHHTHTANLPGFFVIPDAVMMQEVFYESSSTSPSTSYSFPTFEDPVTIATTVSTKLHASEEKEDIEQTGPFYQGHPLHTGQTDETLQNPRIETSSESYREDMLQTLRLRGTDTNPSFEPAPDLFKSATYAALESSSPCVLDALITGIKSAKCLDAIYGVVPRQSDVANIKSKMQSKHWLMKRKACNENVCDWINLSSLNRCYHRNESEYKAGRIIYNNDSVDDFRDNAPLECNLCLPEVDQKQIDIHCKLVGRMEKRLLKILLVMGGIGVALVVAGTVCTFVCKRHREVPRKKVPAAMRGGFLDKRMIGRPVLIPRPAEQMEGAFENPRAAPALPRV